MKPKSCGTLTKTVNKSSLFKLIFMISNSVNQTCIYCIYGLKVGVVPLLSISPESALFPRVNYVSYQFCNIFY